MKPLDPRLLKHASAARRFVLIGVGIAVATAALVLVQAQLLATVVAEGFLGGAGLAVLAPLLGGVALIVAGRAVLAWASEITAHRAAADVVRQLRSQLVTHVLRLGPRHRELPPTGELATLSARGLDDLEGYFGRYLPALLIATVVPLMVGVRILTADWISGLIVGLTVPLIPIFAILIGLHTERSTRRQWRTLAVLGHHFLDLVSGLEVLTAFGRAKQQTGRLRTLADAYRAATMKTLRVAFLSALVLEVLASLSVALVAVSIGLRLVDGTLDLQTGLMVLILAPEVYLPLRAVGARFHDAAAGTAAATSALDVLETPVPARGSAPAPALGSIGVGTIRLDGIRVDGRSGPILDDLSMDIPAGTVLGVSGPSGCGKSTLLDVLAGLRPPDGGRLLVGDPGAAGNGTGSWTDLAGVERTAWLRQVAWVPQRPVLLEGTVGSNIALARPDASPDELRAAADAALLDVDLAVPVGEDGAGLSTGQRRRVALARAVLADRPLLLLDEPTEGVDADTEASIVGSLPLIAAGRTVVLVSHRPDVLASCDRVLDFTATARPADPALPSAAAGPPTTSVVSPSPVNAPRATPAQPPARPADPLPAGGGQAAPAAARSATETGDSPAFAALRWILQAAAAHRWRLAGGIALGTGALGSAVALTGTSAWLISAAALQPPILSLMVAIVGVRAFGIAKGVLRYLERLVSHDAALRVGTALRVRIWENLVRLGPAVTARSRRGDLLTRLVADTDAPQDLLVRVLVPVASSLLVGLGVVVALGLLLPEAGLAVLAGLIVAGLVAPAIAAQAALNSERRTAAARAEVASRTVALLDAAADLLVLGAAERYQAELDAADRRLGALRRQSSTALGLGSGIGVLAVGLTSAIGAALGVLAFSSGTLAGPGIAVLALTPLALAEVVAALPEAAVRLLSIIPAAIRLRGLEQLEPAVSEPEAPVPVPAPQSLSARGVSLRWPDSTVDVVAGLDLDLGGHRRIALTGPSGSGKSTVVAALLRTLDPVSGELRADGREVRSVRADDVRAGIAWCGSWTHLFDSSLRANLALAAPEPDAAASGTAEQDGALVAALRRARLGEWFDGLPEGLDTTVGEHGGAVSGGERQRIGIARALLADRPILLLDEPTAHLDAPTGEALAAEILASTADRTALIATHRPEQTPGIPQLRCPSAARLAHTGPPVLSRHDQ